MPRNVKKLSMRRFEKLLMPGGEGYKSAFVKTAWAPGEAMLARSWHFVAQMRLIHDPS